MTSRQTTSAPQLRPNPKVMEAANQLRAKCNALSDEKRSALLQRGLDVIYGYGRNTPLPPAGRR
jgi:hypothetical protein